MFWCPSNSGSRLCLPIICLLYCYPLYRSKNNQGRRSPLMTLPTIFRHLSPSSAVLWLCMLYCWSSLPVHSFIGLLSLFFFSGFPLSLTNIMPCKIFFERTFDFTTCPYHCNFSLSTLDRRSFLWIDGCLERIAQWLCGHCICQIVWHFIISIVAITTERINARFIFY